MWCCLFSLYVDRSYFFFFFFQAEDGIRDVAVTGVQTCALPISRPDRHTLLMVIAGTVIGMPAATAAWRAGICPAPAWRTWPMMTYWTSPPLMPERSSAALITTPPRSVAARSLSEPSRRPMGVLAPPVITASGMVPSAAPPPRYGAVGTSATIPRDYPDDIFPRR